VIHKSIEAAKTDSLLLGHGKVADFFSATIWERTIFNFEAGAKKKKEMTTQVSPQAGRSSIDLRIQESRLLRKK